VKVNINGAGHQVEIDVDHTDLNYVIEKAQKLYEDTRPDKAGPGYAGFQMEHAAAPGFGKYGADFRLGERPAIEGSTSGA
jgi:hypothetical protein